MKPIAVLLIFFAFFAGVGATLYFAPPSRVTEADVRAYIDKRSGIEDGRKFDIWMSKRPYSPPPRIEFPETIADPIMWDWVDHAILRKERQVWIWSRSLASVACSPPTFVTTMTNGVITTSNSTGTTIVVPTFSETHWHSQ